MTGTTARPTAPAAVPLPTCPLSTWHELAPAPSRARDRARALQLRTTAALAGVALAVWAYDLVQLSLS